MDHDENAPVLAVAAEPESESALVRPMRLNVAGTVAATIATIEAVEVDGGSVVWLNESGKGCRQTANPLASENTHRLNAALIPDDTIDRRPLMVGETTPLTGDLLCADVTPATLAAFSRLAIDSQPGEVGAG